MSTMQDQDGMPAATLAALLASRREFVAFVQRRVGDAAVAEDLVQDAFVKGLRRGGQLRQSESVRAWFFRILRRAIVDRARRERVVAATLDRAAAELQGDLAVARSVDDHEVCACLLALVDALPPTQAAVLRRVELEGQSVKAFAAEAGIGESNAGVRVFRARRALRELVRKACGACAEHGCLDCCCRKPGDGGGAVRS
jgi:RNA polymerase sigma-70 factor (ECF subfamily)